MARELASFTLPKILDNPSGWGPGESIGAFDDPLFQPYNKAERLSKISDWTVNNRSRGRAGTAGSGFAFKADDDESFSVQSKNRFKTQFGKLNRNAGGFRASASAARAPTQRSGAIAGNRAGGNTRQAGGRRDGGRQANVGRGGRQPFRGGRNYRNNYFREEASKDPSVPISGSWEQVDELTFDELQNASVASVEAETVLTAGKLVRYTDSVDAIVPKFAKGLPLATTVPFSASASADPYMKELAEKETADIYITESALSLLMCAHKTVAPWDLLVTCTPTAVFVDYRADSTVPKLMVHENASDNLPTEAESNNTAEKLCNEATKINHDFQHFAVCVTAPASGPATGMSFAALAASGPASLQLSTDAIEQERPVPNAATLPAGKSVAATAFRYRSFVLSPEGDAPSLAVCVRASVHAYKPIKEGSSEAAEGKETEEIVIKTLNEFDAKIAGGIEWAKELEQRPGAVLAAENKNNAARMARVTAEALISGADTLKIGFLSRLAPKDEKRHRVLKVETYDPTRLASTMRLNAKAFWSSALPLLQAINGLENGKYVMMRDPNRPAVRVYKVPEETFNAETNVFHVDSEAPSTLGK